jgi:hypothetical protein
MPTTEETHMATDRKAARATVSELRTLLLNAPELFEEQVQELIRDAESPVTKRFWTEVREAARRQRLSKKDEDDT